MFYFDPFSMFQILFVIVFLLILSFIVVTVIRNLLQWNKNNHSPKLTVDASIVGKRTHVSRNGGGANYSTHTSYYVTFQVASGDRLELKVNGQEYGLLVEGDRGNLTFQGTRYLGFQRN